MDKNSISNKEVQVECANCRKQFIWDDAYQDENTPGAMPHIPLGKGLWYPRAFCPHCGALIAEWHITRVKDFNEWMWFGDNASINSGNSLPPSPLYYWGKYIPRQLIPHYDEHKLDIEKVKGFETEKEGSVKIPSEDQQDWKQPYEKAFGFLKERNYTKALELIQKAVIVGLPEQEHAEILGFIGEHYLINEKDVDSAQKYFLSSIKTHFSGFWKAHKYLAFIYEVMGNNRKSKQEHADAERANPHESLIPEFEQKIHQIIRTWAEKQTKMSKGRPDEVIPIMLTEKSKIIRKLQILKSTILEIPRKYPSRTKVIGVDISQAEEQIPIISSNIDDAISALKKGKDTYNRPITNHEIAYGLNNLINATTRNPGFLVFVSSVLDRSGIIELERKMGELTKIVENIKIVSIEPEQLKVLEELEKTTSKSIPQVEQIRLFSFGVSTEGDNIVGLGLYECGLTTLPESIGGLKSLRELTLDNNKLTALPESISNLKSLKILWIQRNELLTLPESIGNLKSLEKLYLWNNKLTTLPDSIGNLTSLTYLNLGVNKLTALPESIGNLKSLQTIDLIGNKLTALPEWIGSLKSLNKLYLKDNELTALPESIGNLSSLKELNMALNKLTTLPESISNLKSLNKLYLKGIGLTTLPESIGNLSSLKELTLDNNKLTTLPKSIGHLKSLNKLYLKGNGLTTLPESIGDLSLLKELTLDYNKLTTLPEWIGSLKSLNKLYLKGNGLTTLPESIGNLSSLNELALDNNKLTTLPKSIGGLKSLRRLTLYSNKLKTLPKSIRNLSSLKKLTLDNNKFTPKTIKFLENLKRRGVKIYK